MVRGVTVLARPRVNSVCILSFVRVDKFVPSVQFFPPIPGGHSHL